MISVENFEYNEKPFALDAVSYRKPMELLQNGSDMISSFVTSYETSGSVLKSLKFLEICFWSSEEQRIAKAICYECSVSTELSVRWSNYRDIF